MPRNDSASADNEHKLEMKIILVSTVLLSTVVLLGCVSRQTHEATLDELANSQRAFATKQAEIESLRKELDDLRQELNHTQLKLDKAQRSLIDFAVQKQDLQKSLVDLETESEELNLQLALLREVEAEANRRNEIYSRFVGQLRHLIERKQISVNIEKGRVVIQLPNKIIFASGRAEINPQGQKTIVQVAKVLAQFPERRFQVEGHTDNRPINSPVFPSNWELSTARALAVVHLLTENGVSPQNLSAAGYGEHQPRADNKTYQGRQLNRRIEVVMLPNLEVLSKDILTPNR